jgi:DNA-binding FadR family transcriptional regulator
MYDAIEAKNAAQAVAVMKQHLKQGAKVWEKIFGAKAARAKRAAARAVREA